SLPEPTSGSTSPSPRGARRCPSCSSTGSTRATRTGRTPAGRSRSSGPAGPAPDLRGHGRSDKPHDPEAYRSSVLVGDLVGALDAAGVAEADVVGYSLGGELALELATRHPERVRRLVAGGIGERRPLTAEDTERVYRYAVEGGPRPDGPAYGMWARAGGRPGSDRVALAACLAGVSGSPPLDGLERFTGPALL